MSIGQTFRTERMRRKLTVLQAAEATRIKPTHIEAMENDDFSSISAPIYAKGFIKLYSELLGLDPEPLVREYMEGLTPGAAAPKFSTDIPLKPVRKEIDPAIVDHSRFVTEEPPPPSASGEPSYPSPSAPRIPSEPVYDKSDRRSPPWVGILVALIVAGGAFGIYKACRPPTPSGPPAAGPASAPPAAAAPDAAVRAGGTMRGELIEFPPLPYLTESVVTGAAPAAVSP